jgi:hypothetical protein
LLEIIYFGSEGVFVTGPDYFPFAIELAITIPILIFLLAYYFSPNFREYILSRNPVILTLMQSWRVIGSMFLALYAHNVLPAFFAIPAGLGDVIIGIWAPFVAYRIIRNPALIKGKEFIIFHILGIVDFMIAAYAGLTLGYAIPGFPLSQMPLCLIPTFAVPLWIILHLICLIQAKENEIGFELT